MIRAIVAVVLMVAQNLPVPVIDGRSSEREWSGARREVLSVGGDLLLLRRGEFLFVAVKGPAKGLASLCVAKGKSVRILHASAALGDAIFERWGDMWMQRKGFEWTLRASARGLPSESARAEMLAKSGWVANPSASGSSDREFQILAKDVDRIGVTFLSIDSMTISAWPSTMNDDCRRVKIAQGYLPDTARFEPATWGKVDK